MAGNFGELAPDEATNKAKTALEKNGLQVYAVKSGQEAKQKIIEIIPPGAQVMNMTSETLNETGIAKEILESGRYNSVRSRLNSMDRKTQNLEMQRLGAAPEWALGSVHAVTEDGKVVVASNTGSQLPAYMYGASHVVWVVGAQKIVRNLDEALKRIYEYVLPLEDARAKRAYGQGSNVSKLFILNKEIQPGRITMIIVKEKLGF